MDLTRDALTDLAFDAASAGGDAPSTLRDRLFDGIGGRAPMHPEWIARSRPGRIDSFGSYARSAAELSDLLASLDSGEWAMETTAAAGSVRELVVHLVGVERYALGQLGRRPRMHAPTRDDHLRVSLEATTDTAGLTVDELARTWWLESLELLRTCGELGPSAPLTFHHLPLSVRGFLVLRTFELWTHGEDIRAATGRERDHLDPERLALMSSGLVDVLSFGMAISGTERPGRSARIVLTGPGGASFDVALAPGEAVGDADTTLTMSTLDLCRVAARHLPLTSVEMVVQGDAALVEPMLVGAQAFAAD